MSVQVIFGGATLGNAPPFDTNEHLKEAYSILLKYDVKRIDSSQLYGQCESILGATRAGDHFTLDTKWAGGQGWATRDNIVNSAKSSIEKLNVKQVDIFYIHIPDLQTSISEITAAVQEVYQLGLFKRFGLSNYLAEDVEKIYDYCKQQGYVLPTVYQGNYSAVARKPETTLYPTLRRLGIAVHAFSPLAGGFLTKTPQQIAEGAGRFNDETYGGVYKQWFVKPVYLRALERWDSIAKAEGCSSAELAHRWVAYHSALGKGDGLIIGANTIERLEQTLVGLTNGKLSDKSAKAIDDIWESVKHEAP
ncbi:aldehyde reductase [Xylogone sp. PMI_703]|nr:aldehyde reductase [Xylogone sp. PMI_703]